jgi:hypothetical protein
MDSSIGDKRHGTPFAFDLGFASADAYDVEIVGGKILVAGMVDLGGGNTAFLLARFNADGSLDASFDSDGFLTRDVLPGADVATGLEEGSLFLGGHAADTPADSAFALAKLDFAEGACGVCGDAQVDLGEDCDGGPCCDGSCQFEAPGAPCEDGDVCSNDDACDGAGACAGGGADDLRRHVGEGHPARQGEQARQGEAPRQADQGTGG